MKVSFDKIVLQGATGVYKQTGGTKRAAKKDVSSSQKVEKSFDEIRISTQKEAAAEEQDFVRMLTAKLSAGLRQNAEPDRLEELKARIDSGKYEIDVNAIASRILLEDRGETQDAAIG